MYHQMEQGIDNNQFMNWRLSQRGEMEMQQLTRYEMPYPSREPDPFRKLQEAEEDWEIALTLLKKMEEKRGALVIGIKN